MPSPPSLRVAVKAVKEISWTDLMTMIDHNESSFDVDNPFRPDKGKYDVNAGHPVSILKQAVAANGKVWLQYEQRYQFTDFQSPAETPESTPAAPFMTESVRTPSKNQMQPVSAGSTSSTTSQVTVTAADFVQDKWITVLNLSRDLIPDLRELYKEKQEKHSMRLGREPKWHPKGKRYRLDRLVERYDSTMWTVDDSINTIAVFQHHRNFRRKFSPNRTLSDMDVPLYQRLHDWLDVLVDMPPDGWLEDLQTSATTLQAEVDRQGQENAPPPPQPPLSAAALTQLKPVSPLDQDGIATDAPPSESSIIPEDLDYTDLTHLPPHVTQLCEFTSIHNRVRKTANGRRMSLLYTPWYFASVVLWTLFDVFWGSNGVFKGDFMTQYQYPPREYPRIDTDGDHPTLLPFTYSWQIDEETQLCYHIPYSQYHITKKIANAICNGLHLCRESYGLTLGSVRMLCVLERALGNIQLWEALLGRGCDGRCVRELGKYLKLAATYPPQYCNAFELVLSCTFRVYPHQDLSPYNNIGTAVLPVYYSDSLLFLAPTLAKVYNRLMHFAAPFDENEELLDVPWYNPEPKYRRIECLTRLMTIVIRLAGIRSRKNQPLQGAMTLDELLQTIAIHQELDEQLLGAVGWTSMTKLYLFHLAKQKKITQWEQKEQQMTNAYEQEFAVNIEVPILDKEEDYKIVLERCKAKGIIPQFWWFTKNKNYVPNQPVARESPSASLRANAPTPTTTNRPFIMHINSAHHTWSISENSIDLGPGFMGQLKTEPKMSHDKLLEQTDKKFERYTQHTRRGLLASLWRTLSVIVEEGTVLVTQLEITALEEQQKLKAKVVTEQGTQTVETEFTDVQQIAVIKDKQHKEHIHKLQVQLQEHLHHHHSDHHGEHHHEPPPPVTGTPQRFTTRARATLLPMMRTHTKHSIYDFIAMSCTHRDGNDPLNRDDLSFISAILKDTPAWVRLVEFRYGGITHWVVFPRYPVAQSQNRHTYMNYDRVKDLYQQEIAQTIDTSTEANTLIDFSYKSLIVLYGLRTQRTLAKLKEQYPILALWFYSLTLKVLARTMFGLCMMSNIALLLDSSLALKTLINVLHTCSCVLWIIGTAQDIIPTVAYQIKKQTVQNNLEMNHLKGTDDYDRTVALHDDRNTRVTLLGVGIVWYTTMAVILLFIVLNYLNVVQFWFLVGAGVIVVVLLLGLAVWGAQRAVMSRPHLKAVTTNFTVLWFCSYLLFAVTAIVIAPFICGSLVLWFLRNSTLRHMIKAVAKSRLKIPLLLGAFISGLWVMVVFMYHFLKYRFYWEHTPYPRFGRLMETFIDVLGYGFQTVFSWREPWFSKEINHIEQFAFNTQMLLYYLLVPGAFFAVLTGIITDDMAKGREEMNSKANLNVKRCFICGRSADEFNMDEQDGFFKHTKGIHNVWDYIHYWDVLFITEHLDPSPLDAAIMANYPHNPLSFMPLGKPTEPPPPYLHNVIPSSRTHV